MKHTIKLTRHQRFKKWYRRRYFQHKFKTFALAKRYNIYTRVGYTVYKKIKDSTVPIIVSKLSK